MVISSQSASDTFFSLQNLGICYIWVGQLPPCSSVIMAERFKFCCVFFPEHHSLQAGPFLTTIAYVCFYIMFISLWYYIHFPALTLNGRFVMHQYTNRSIRNPKSIQCNWSIFTFACFLLFLEEVPNEPFCFFVWTKWFLPRLKRSRGFDGGLVQILIFIHHPLMNPVVGALYGRTPPVGFQSEKNPPFKTSWTFRLTGIFCLVSV